MTAVRGATANAIFHNKQISRAPMPTVKKQVEVEISLEDFEDHEIASEYDARGLGEPEMDLSDYSDSEIQSEYESRRDSASVDSVLERIYEKMRGKSDAPKELADLIYDRIGRILWSYSYILSASTGKTVTRSQARAKMRSPFNATRRADNIGWYYVNPASIDVYAARPGCPANTCRLTKRQLEAALKLMRAASNG